MLQVNKTFFLIAVAHIIVVSFIIQYELTKLEISTVLIFMNTGPILTVFGGGLFFKDQKLTWEIIAKVLVAFIGVLLIVLGDTQETEDVLTIP